MSLREKVAIIIFCTDGALEDARKAADAAIALCMEEAAKWLEVAPPHLSMQEYAAAIRALAKEGK